MAYADAAQLEEHLGADRYVDLADRDRSGTVDEEAVDQALAKASSLVDSYITRYLPIAEPPDVVVDAVLEVATYKLAGNRATQDERQRYEDAIAWLTRVGARKANLALPETPMLEPGGDVIVDAPRAQFRHDQTRRIL